MLSRHAPGFNLSVQLLLTKLVPFGFLLELDLQSLRFAQALGVSLGVQFSFLDLLLIFGNSATRFSLELLEPVFLSIRAQPGVLYQLPLLGQPAFGLFFHSYPGGV